MLPSLPLYELAGWSVEDLPPDLDPTASYLYRLDRLFSARFEADGTGPSDEGGDPAHDREPRTPSPSGLDGSMMLRVEDADALGPSM